MTWAAVMWTSTHSVPGTQRSMAARSAACTTACSSACSGLKRPPTGYVRVMSEAYWR